MNTIEELFFATKADWREWLEKNHAQKEAVWLVFYKKKTEQTTLSYNDAVEQALCFGWIDSIVKRIDNEKYKRKLTPRINFYNWSESNKIRVKKLISTKEMTETGLAKIGDYAKNSKIIWPKPQEIALNFSENIFKLLIADKEAFEKYNNLTKANQKRYIQWVMQAKRENTKEKRMLEFIELIKNNVPNLIK